jgi:hypothetical protein
MECRVAIPEATAAREGRVAVQKLAKDSVCGELTISLPIGAGK